MRMGSYHLLEHTADMGLEATGESAEELFAEAACALREIIAGPCRGRPLLQRRIHIEGGDPGELLVGWLNEILYLFECGRLFPASFQVVRCGNASMEGIVHGEPFDPARHHVEREVKAVTYHQLLVEHRGAHWRARVYVDL